MPDLSLVRLEQQVRELSDQELTQLALICRRELATRCAPDVPPVAFEETGYAAWPPVRRAVPARPAQPVAADCFRRQTAERAPSPIALAAVSILGAILIIGVFYFLPLLGNPGSLGR